MARHSMTLTQKILAAHARGLSRPWVQAGDILRVRFVFAVAEVDASHVHTRPDHLTDDRLIGRSWPNGTHDLCTLNVKFPDQNVPPVPSIPYVAR